MHKYVSLTKALIKCSMGMLQDGKNKKSLSMFLYSIILVSMIPIMYIIYDMTLTTFRTLGPIDQAALPLGMMIFMASMVIFFFSIFLIPSIFYFSNDNQILLTLPLKPEQIIGAKFSVCTLYEYAFAAVILLPTFIAYAIFATPGIMFYLAALITFLLVPIFPLVCSTIFTILIMRFVPFFKNRDRFNMIASFIAISLALGLSFMSNSFSSIDNQEQLLSLFLQGNNSLLRILSSLFPAISYFAKALSMNDVVSLLIAITITALALIVLLTLGKYLYFKGAIGFGETSSTSKTLNQKDLHKANQSHNKIRTVALKDFRIILRTPAYLTNCVSMCIIMPLLLFFIPSIDKSITMEDAFDLLSIVDQIPNLPAYIICIGFGLGFALGSINLISSTAISREGSHVDLMKYIPMSYSDQAHAKCLPGIFMGILTNALILVPVYLLLPINPIYYAIAFGCSCITTILGNLIGISVDMIHPKLIWEQEATAVKQNMGGMVSIFLGMALCVGCIALCFIIPENIVMIATLSIFVVVLIGTILSWFLVGRLAEKLLRNL